MLNRKLTAEILDAAIEGFEARKIRIDEQIAQVRQLLNGDQPVAANTSETQNEPRRKMSASARKRIGDAQRKRWAAMSSAKTASTRAAKPKRKLSAAGRAAIVAALIWLASDQTNVGLPGLILAFLVTAIAGALMISRFAFYSFKSVSASARVRFTYIVLIVVAIVCIALHPAVMLLTLFGCYALSAPLLWLYRKLLRKRTRSVPQT